jgi:hypothetical protein
MTRKKRAKGKEEPSSESLLDDENDILTQTGDYIPELRELTPLPISQSGRSGRTTLYDQNRDERQVENWKNY